MAGGKDMFSSSGHAKKGGHFSRPQLTKQTDTHIYILHLQKSGIAKKNKLYYSYIIITPPSQGINDEERRNKTNSNSDNALREVILSLLRKQFHLARSTAVALL